MVYVIEMVEHSGYVDLQEQLNAYLKTDGYKVAAHLHDIEGKNGLTGSVFIFEVPED